MAALLWASPGWAQFEGAGQDDGWLEEGDDSSHSRRPPNLSNDLLDPAGLSRFHLTTRFAPGLPEDTFSDDLRWTIVPALQLRLRPGLTLGAALPLAIYAPNPGENSFINGNLRVGVAGGGYVRLKDPEAGEIAPRLGFGGAFDIYAPIANGTGNVDCVPSLNVCDAVGTVRNMHAYEPELFADEAMFFRARMHADIAVSIFSAEVELGLSPGFTAKKDPQFLLLMSWAARLSLKAGAHFEPYAEVANAQQVAGKSLDIRLNPNLTVMSITGADLSTPVMLTLGLRTHFAGMDPALFVSIDTRDSVVIFGLDLAGALRPGPSRRDDGDDFLQSGDSDPWD